MKKKLLLILLMFIFITNAKALTFNVDITNIQNEGNNGTMGYISNIDVPNKTLNADFSGIGDQVSFSIIITNSGDRAGTLKSIDITSTNDKIEYTTNLPAGGLAINGNDFNTVTITSKVLDGATNGTSTSTIKITYNYDEGSCPDGEILSDDESMCSCPEGKVRNEHGVCVDPPKPVTCKEDEIYNEAKKACEKKVIPVEPDDPVEPDPTPEPTPEPKPTPVIPENPKTLDNIILITLLFIVSGLGIYAIVFKKLKTNKQRVSVGVGLGVATFALSFTTLAFVFGIDKLLGAIINPITKKQELTVTVNENITMIETWDGSCRTNSYAPEDVFESGTGTESDPYTIKTANQLACFAESVNEGNTYKDKYIKQIKDIKLNDSLNADIEAEIYTGHHEWRSIGDEIRYGGNVFSGTYDGDNHTISGIFLTNSSANYYAPKGLFGVAKGATFRNMVLSDVYIEVSPQISGALVGKAFDSITIDNVVASGKYSEYSLISGGLVGAFESYSINNGFPMVENEFVKIENSTNNISPVSGGIIGSIHIGLINGGVPSEPTVTFRNVTNNGDVVYNTSLSGGIGGITDSISISLYDGLESYNMIGPAGYVLIENAVNNGQIGPASRTNFAGGIASVVDANKLVIKDSYNTGDIITSNADSSDYSYIGGLIAEISAWESLEMDGCSNSGILQHDWNDSYIDGLTLAEVGALSGQLANVGGLVGKYVSNANPANIIKNSYNTGDIKTVAHITGGILGFAKQTGYQDASGDNITIQNCYNEGDIYTVYGNTGGIVGLTGGTITGSHNSGEIIVAGRKPGANEYANLYTNTVGGIVASHTPEAYDSTHDEGDYYYDILPMATVINSYNEGDIHITAKDNRVLVGGICGSCDDITGSHNSGNIIATYATQTLEGIAIYVKNTADAYNEGTITPGSGY